MRTAWNRLRRVIFGVSLAAASAAGAGCATERRVLLTQEFAPAAQKVLYLDEPRAFFAEQDASRTLAASFPLPGSSAGPTAYVLLARGPAGVDEWTIGADGARGFLIQELGTLRGKSMLASGTIRFSSALFKPGWRDVDVALRCVDGAELNGDFNAQRSAPDTAAVARRYRADAELLDETPPAE